MKELLSNLLKPFVLFYMVFVYILIFSGWWSYLLLNKNQEVFNERVALESLRYRLDKTNPAIDFRETDAYRTIHSDHRKQRVMIISEGMTFLLLIVLGLMMVRRSFLREIQVNRQQRNFLLSVTHELKSPLASIKVALQTMLRHVLPQEQSRKLQGNAMQDVDRLEVLVENVLLAAKVEDPSYRHAAEEVHLSEIVAEVCERIERNAPEGLDFKANIEPNVFVNGDSLGLTSVVTNLVENAVKYAVSDGGLAIRIELQNGEQVELSVTDSGPGIPAEDRHRIFDKFYRVGNEDTRRSKGTGLGLFIVKRVVELHGGEISVQGNLPKGSRFLVRLPPAV